MGIPENIDALLVKFDLKPESLARIAGVTTATVSRWRNGRTDNIRRENLDKICSALELEPDDILSSGTGLAAKEHGCFKRPNGAIDPIRSAPAYRPLLGRVHAGEAQEPDVLDDTVELPASVASHHPNAYFLQVEGDCMSKVYPEGCYILIDPDQTPQNGSIAVVSIDGADYVMRRLYKGASTVVLSPDSAQGGYEDIVIGSDSDRTVEFHGTVVWFQPNREMR